jgi:hypothetical protein
LSSDNGNGPGHGAERNAVYLPISVVHQHSHHKQDNDRDRYNHEDLTAMTVGACGRFNRTYQRFTLTDVGGSSLPHGGRGTHVPGQPVEVGHSSGLTVRSLVNGQPMPIAIAELLRIE